MLLAQVLGALASSAALAALAVRHGWAGGGGGGRGCSSSSSISTNDATPLLGTPVKLLVASSADEINLHLGTLLRGGPTCLGLDAEWRPERGRQGRQSPVAVLQLASEDVVVVLQMLRATDGGRQEAPRLLRELLAAPHIVKMGVGIHDDAQRLRDSFGLECRGCLDLRALLQDRSLALHSAAAAAGGPAPAPGLKGLAAHVGIPVDKEHEVRVSDWQAHTLTAAQVKYAAEDGATCARTRARVALDTTALTI